MTLPRLIREGRYVLLDIESTGLSTKKDEPVSLAFGIIDYGVTMLRGYFTLKPSVPVKYNAMQKHGLSEHKLQHSPTFAEIAEMLRDHYLSNRIVLGWCVKKFDVPILQRMFKETPNMSEWNPQILDALLWDRHFHPDRGHKLVNAVIHYNIPSHGFHDAWADSRLTWSVFCTMAAQHPELGELSPEEALQIQDNNFTWENFSRAERTSS